MNAPLRFRPYLLALVALLFASASSAQSEHQAIIDETIALARSYLGDPAKLDAVSSLAFSGVVVAGNGDSGTTEIVYKAPLRSQMATVINGIREVSTLNRTEAWRRVERVDRPGAWSLEFYPIHDIHRMQALATATLDFLKRPKGRGARVSYEGTETVDGREARVLVYHYGNGIWYKRFIDAKSGRLLKTESDAGMVSRESGEIVSDGIRFPAKVVTESRGPRGGIAKMEVSYSRVQVNPSLPDERFRVPLLTGQ